MTREVVFTNDNGVVVKVPDDHPFSSDYVDRYDCEPLFRRLHTFMINNGVIKNNFVDLGAWIGDNTIPWAANISGKVYAIDPSPSNCDYIRQLCALNNTANVVVMQHAVSDVNEVLSTNDCINHCSFVFGGCGTSGQTRVDAVSLDYLYERGVVENVGYIHLDVEGMENKILRGSSRLIDACRPVITFEQHLEIDDYDLILSFLAEKHYKVFLIDEVFPGCRRDCRNSLAFPAESYDEAVMDKLREIAGPDMLIEKTAR